MNNILVEITKGTVDIMVDWKRFQTPVFILGCAAVMYYVGSKQSYSNTKWLIQTCSLPLGAIGLWSLATLLGKPPQKMDMSQSCKTPPILNTYPISQWLYRKIPHLKV